MSVHATGCERIMKIAGLVSFTTIDFPGRLAAVVFLKGCPLRCPFCHNPDLQSAEGDGTHRWDEIEQFLKSRTKRLDGVVFSGGEPLMQPEIVDVVHRVKQMGFQVGIHTSGFYVDRLRALLPDLSWVGLDIKSAWNTYHRLSGLPNEKLVPAVQHALKLLLESGIEFECRTTCDPRYLTKQDIRTIATDLHALGVQHYALQKYRTFEGDKNPPDEAAIQSFFTDAELMTHVRAHFPNLICR